MDLRKIIQPASVALALMASSFTPGVVRADIEGVVVHFNAGMTPPSPLRLRNAEKQGREPRQFPAEKLKGYLYKSKSNEAGIVLAPGCLGVKQFHHAWARRLADWGYTALIVDSAGSRGMNQNCAGEHLLGFREAALDRRVYDVFGAHEFLTTGKGVNPKRIALMGWGYADTLAAVLETGVQRFFNASFAAAVAYYPSCRTAPTGRFVAPLLLLIGAKDDWSTARGCEKMKNTGLGGPSVIEMIVYADAHHGFDDPEIKKITIHPNVWNANKVPNKGATLLYNKQASSDSRQRVKAFLNNKL